MPNRALERIARSDATPRSAFLSHAFCRAVNKVRGGVSVVHLRNDPDEEGFLRFKFGAAACCGHGEKVAGGMSDFFGVVGKLRSRVDADILLESRWPVVVAFRSAVQTLCPLRLTIAKRVQGARLHCGRFRAIQNRSDGIQQEIHVSRFCRASADLQASLAKLFSAGRRGPAPLPCATDSGKAQSISAHRRSGQLRDPMASRIA